MKARLPARRAQAGYTLIEVLLATVVLAAGLAWVVRSITAAHVGSVSAVRTYRAAVLLNERIERLQAEASLGEGVAAGVATGTEETSEGTYRWELTCIPDGEGLLADCDLVYAWNESARQRRLGVRLCLETKAAA